MNNNPESELLRNSKKPRIFIDVIESMRGLAAFGVVAYHFANGTLTTISPIFFGYQLEWARLGIPLFFVISGFVIPYSMYSAGYELKDAGRYFLKRMIRMAPPSWISILMIIAIYLTVIAINGKPIQGMDWPGFSPKALAANFCFSFKLLDVRKYIDVYWTLEVEFQFYIVIALVYPLLMRFSNNLIALSLILILLNSTWFFFANRILFFELNSYFILGILLFMYRMQLIPRNYFVYASVAMTVLCYLQIGEKFACAAVIGVLTIALVRFRNPVTDFLGMISFSLYITHHCVGVVSEYFLRNISGMEPSQPVKLIMYLVYLAIAIGFATLFYRFIEKPFLEVSKRISLKGHK